MALASRRAWLVIIFLLFVIIYLISISLEDVKQYALSDTFSSFSRDDEEEEEADILASEAIDDTDAINEIDDVEEEVEEDQIDDDETTTTMKQQRKGPVYFVNEFNETIKRWRWSKPKRNILYVKIPKTGGTTLAESVARLARHSNWVMAKPNDKSKVNTCGPYGDAERSWSDMVWANGGRIGAFASHACLRDFMKNKRYWSMRRVPEVITLMRHPWDHYISKYRFSLVCCEMKHWSWCEVFCPKDSNGNRVKMTHTRYAEIACSKGRCNEQRLYMGSGPTERILNDFGLVIILEKFDEGLALLAVKFGFPFQSLPYLRENANTLVKMPNFTTEYRKEVQNKHMNLDMDLYRAAKARHEKLIEDLTEEERTMFDYTYKRLREVNTQLREACQAQCGMYTALSKPRRMCDNSCIERILDQYD